MTWESVVMVTTALGGAGGVVAVLLLPSQIRKFRAENKRAEAEAFQLIGSTAAEMLKSAKGELASLGLQLSRAKKEIRDLSRKVTQMTAEVEQRRAREKIIEQEWNDKLGFHRRWDLQAVAKFQELGTEFPPPPPLIPGDNAA